MSSSWDIPNWRNLPVNQQRKYVKQIAKELKDIKERDDVPDFIKNSVSIFRNEDEIYDFLNDKYKESETKMTTNRDILNEILKETNNLLSQRLQEKFGIRIKDGITINLIKEGISCSDFINCADFDCEKCPFSYDCLDAEYKYQKMENESTAFTSREISW